MYDDIKLQLSHHFPQLTYIVGGRQSGKTTLAKAVIEANEFPAADVTWYQEAIPLSYVETWLNTGSIYGKKILVVDDSMTPDLRELLLRWSEEPVAGTHVLVLGGKYPIDTLSSRATVYLLKVDESYAPPVYTEVKGVVLALLRAFQDKDAESLDEIATRWTDSHTALLLDWCQEHLTKQFNHFTGEEVSLPEALPMAIIKSMVSDVRPRFLVRGPLAELLWSMK